MDTKKPRHNLSNVDLERRTATCAVCGDTAIYIDYTTKRPKILVSCLNRMRTNATNYRQRIRKRRTQDPNWKPRHQVVEVDPETMTGICSLCGLITVYQRTVANKTYYLCSRKRSSIARRNSRKRVTSQPRTYKSSLVRLAQGNQREALDKYKVERGCQSCGYNTDPDKLELHFEDVNEQEFTMSRLVHFTRRRLLHVLRISEIYCVNCHPLVHSETSVEN